MQSRPTTDRRLVSSCRTLPKLAAGQVICSLPQLEKLDNTPITAQERAEALRFGEPVDWAAEWDGRRGEDPLPASSDQENQERRLSLSLYGDQEEYMREAQLQEDRREARYGDSYSVAGYQDSSSISQYGVMERAAQQEDVRSVWQYGDTRDQTLIFMAGRNYG